VDVQKQDRGLFYGKRKSGTRRGKRDLLEPQFIQRENHGKRVSIFLTVAFRVERIEAARESGREQLEELNTVSSRS